MRNTLAYAAIALTFVLFLAVIPLFIIAVSTIFLEGTWDGFVAAIPEGYARFPNTSPEAAYAGVPVLAAPQWRWLCVRILSCFLP